jgi:hypothetical protein
MKLLHRHAIANGLALNRYRFKKISLSKFQKWRNSFFAPGAVTPQTIQQECLDHFIVFGRKHMDVLCSEFKVRYHAERPHQGLDNELLQQPPKSKPKRAELPPATVRLSDVYCKERLGGLLKSYSLKSAA